MDSGNESEPTSIKLRKYAKKARIGLLKMQDGKIHDVPGWSEEPGQTGAPEFTTPYDRR